MQPYNENGQAVVVIHIVIGQYTCMRITMLTLPQLYWTEYTLTSQYE